MTSLGRSAPTSVLLVDDDPGVLKLLRRTLTEAGYTVTAASDGKQAVAVFRQRPAQVLITDVIMPDQEGVETIMKLKREYPRLRIVAMSGAVGGKYLRLAELAGADAVLQKPFRPEALLSTLRKVLL